MDRNASTAALALEMEIWFARKVADQYERQQITDDPHYADVLQHLAELEDQRSSVLSLQLKEI